MIIREYDNFEFIETIKEQWDSFVKKEKPDQWFFYSFDWYKNWWEAFGVKGKIIIICAYEGEELVGTAAFFSQKSFYLGVYTEILRLMANEHSPKNQLIVKNSSTDIFNAILDYIKNHHGKGLIYFEDIDIETNSYKGIINYCNSNKLDFKERIERTTAIIMLKGTWNELLKKKSDKFRRDLRKAERRINDKKYFIKHYTTNQEIDDFFSQVKTISKNSWQGKEYTSFGSNDLLKTFYYKVANLAANANLWDSLCLFIDETPIAYLFIIRIQDTLYHLKKEFNVNYSEYAPGFYLDSISIKEEYERETGCVDMLGFSTPYKERWATAIKKDGRIFIYQGLAAKTLKYIDFNLRSKVKDIVGKANG